MSHSIVNTKGGGIVSNDATFGGTVTTQNTGLHVLDSDATHDLILKPGSNITADRTFTITTGDVDRTLTLGADVALDQNLTTTSAVTFTGLTISS